MFNLKHHFLLDPSVTFLNHGSFAATPRPVYREYQRWQREMEKQPVEFLGRCITQLLADSRATEEWICNVDIVNVSTP
jgi:isopenicillin-N epimerase